MARRGARRVAALEALSCSLARLSQLRLTRAGPYPRTVSESGVRATDWITLATAIFGILAAIATGFAAWYARAAAQSGRDAVKLTRDAVQSGAEAASAAKDTVELTRQTRADYQHDRHRERFEHIGALVEAIFWAANEVKKGYGASAPEWMKTRNRLRQALVGLESSLPQCVQLLNAHDERQAFDLASRARSEVEVALLKLERSEP